MVRMTKDRWTAVAMITPSIILLGIFVYGFIAQTAWTSLTNWGTPGGAASLAEHPVIDFVGLKNYQDLFTGFNPRFRLDLVNEVFFTALFLAACLGLGLLMAILLDQKVRGESLFRTVFLFPMALSFVVTGTIWRWLFAPNGGLNVLPSSIVNAFSPNSPISPLPFEWFTSKSKLLTMHWHDVLTIVGVAILLFMFAVASTYWFKRRNLTVIFVVVLSSLAGVFIIGGNNIPSFVANEVHGLNVAIISIVIAATWQMSGYTMAIYLAGLRGIPDELREAARVDGATEFQVYRYVILPLLQPITLSAAIILGHISLKIFDLVYVMAGDGNLQVDVPGVNMYLTAFRANNFALGSAIAMIMLLLVAVIIVPYLYTSLRGEKHA